MLLVLQALRQEWQKELEQLQADMEHKRRLAAAEIRSKAEEETIRVRLSCTEVLAHENPGKVLLASDCWCDACVGKG